MKQLEPNFGFAVLKSVEITEQTYGNIVIPDMSQDAPSMGEVVSIAPIYNFNTDREVESKFAVGDIVIYPPMSAKKTKLDNETYFIINIAEIFTSIKEK